MTNAPTPICRFTDCTQKHYAKGWCKTHYQQARRGQSPRKVRGEYTDVAATCAASDCAAQFSQRSIGSPRKFCSRNCRDRENKRTLRASGWLPPHKRAETERCSVDGCDNAKYVRGFCPMHLERMLKYGVPGEPGRRRAPTGEAEWSRTRDGYIRRSYHGRIELQHRVIMEEHIGRFLWPDENVHHRNGQRDDNRIENLELWSKSQPAGQSVEDKITWAREFLTRYGYTVHQT